MSEVTLLNITGIEISDPALRGLTAQMQPIEAAIMQRRNLNGTLRNLSLPQFQGKYRVTISCKDQESPIFVDVDLGTVVTVTLIPFMGTGRDSDDEPEQLVLQMMVQGWSVSSEEAPVATSWQLVLESV